MYVHFAAFQAQAGSEQSWSRVDTPREEGDEQGGRRREQEGVPTPQDGNATAEERPEVYQMTPDPLQENDPWQAWMNTDQTQGSGGPSHSTYVPMPSQSGVTVPAWHVPEVRSFLEVSGLATTRPQVGDGREQLLLPPLPPSYATTTQALQSIVESTMGGGSAAAEAIGMFTQVHARRQERRRDHHRDQHQEPEQGQQSEPRETRPRGDGGLEVYQDTCTICLNRFVAEDHCCRMQCRHVFHCVCIGEYLQHAAPVNETDIRMNCPNCREETQVDRSWIQPTFNLQQPQTVEEQLEEAVRTPVPSEGSEVSAEEYVTPDAPRAYPWWPIPETNPPTPAEPGETSQGYLTTVRGDDGQLGLLVDPGSYSNLAGSGWVEEVEKTLRDQGVASAREQRAAPLRVGGVGRGSQNCREDVRIPLAIPRSDGSVKGGTYTAPVIEGSNAPALLGLKSLTQHRAVLDLVSNQLHLLGPGESRFELTEGTETFNLVRAPTGHLLLPFQEFARLPEVNQGVRHLFSEEGIDEAGYMTTVQAGVCKDEPPATLEDASRAAEPAAQPTTLEDASSAIEPAALEPAESGQDSVTQAVEASEAAAEEAAEDPVDEPKKVEPKTEDQSPTSPADQPVTREEHQTAEAVEAVPTAPAQEAEPEPRAAATSRHTGDFENLTLDEIADRVGLQSNRQLEEDPSEERSRRRRRRRRKRRCEETEKTQLEG